MLSSDGVIPLSGWFVWLSELVDWLIGWLVGWLVYRLVNWLVACRKASPEFQECGNLCHKVSLVIEGCRPTNPNNVLRVQDSKTISQLAESYSTTLSILRNLLQRYNSLGSTTHRVQDTLGFAYAKADCHDILHSYYKVGLKRFFDSVRMQAADYYLITGSETPLTLFSLAFVAGMTPGQMEEVAGEDLIIQRRRLQLEKEQRDLEDGKKILS